MLSQTGGSLQDEVLGFQWTKESSFDTVLNNNRTVMLQVCQPQAAFHKGLDFQTQKDLKDHLIPALLPCSNPPNTLASAWTTPMTGDLPVSSGNHCIIGHVILLERASPGEQKSSGETWCLRRVLSSAIFNSVSLRIIRHKKGDNKNVV